MNEFPTQPDGRVDADALRVTKNGARYYQHPSYPGELFVNTTRVANFYDNKAGLSYWQRGVLADKWLDDPNYAQRLLDEGVDARKQLVSLPDRASKEAAEQGTLVHSLVERTLTSNFTEQDAEHVVRDKYTGGPVYKSVFGKYKQAFKALSALRAVPVAAEAVCYNTTAHTKYAGALDLVVQLDKTSPLYTALDLPNERTLTCFVDFKTGKGVYEQSALQLAAYANSTEFYSTPEKLELDWSYTVALVLHLKERTYHWVPVNVGQAWSAFLACLAVYTSKQTYKNLLLEPVL